MRVNVDKQTTKSHNVTIMLTEIEAKYLIGWFDTYAGTPEGPFHRKLKAALGTQATHYQ